jgi:hypothetical protein
MESVSRSLPWQSLILASAGALPLDTNIEKDGGENERKVSAANVQQHRHIE